MSKKVIKNFSLLTVSNFVNQFVLVFSGIKVARTIGPASYGVYSYLTVEMYIYGAISDLGLRNIVIRTIARNPDKARVTFFTASFLQFIGLIFACLLMFIYEHYTHSINPSLIFYLILAVFLTTLWANCESVWQGHQRMGIPAIIDVSYSIIWVIFVLLTPASIFTVEFLFKFYCYSQVLQVGTLVLYTFFTKGILQGKIMEIYSTGARLLKESSPYYLNNMMTLPTSSLSNNFLERNSTKQQLGYFNTSNRLMSPVRIVINLGLSALFPNLSALWVNNKEAMLIKVSDGFPIFAVTFGWVCFSFALLSKEFVLVLFGTKYLPSVAIMQFQVWFIFIFALNSFIGTVWGATDNQKLLGRCGILNSLLATPILYFGSKLGGLGLAYSYLLAYVLFFPLLLYLFKKSLNLTLTVAKEYFVIFILFGVSVFTPADTSVFIRIALIAGFFGILFKLYFKRAKKLQVKGAQKV